jgi:SAM-dependent methyltransferase
VNSQPITANGLAAHAIAAGEPTAWFDKLYSAAAQDEAQVPWDRRAPHPLLLQWAGEHAVDGTARNAIVVGCGLGEDAELLASLGFATTAFDIAPAAVSAARARFPSSPVSYTVADLFDLPDPWIGAFSFVFESLTVQSLPRTLRMRAIAAVRSLVAPGGRLLVVSGALGDDDPDDGPPWLLSRAELDEFAADGLVSTGVDNVPGSDGGGSTRWLAAYLRG